MTVTIEIPDRIAGMLSIDGGDAVRGVLEAIALEGYRTEQLTEADIRQLLGFETRMEVHGFLKDHGAFMHYTREDLDHDSAAAIEVAQKMQAQRQAASALRPAE